MNKASLVVFLSAFCFSSFLLAESREKTKANKTTGLVFESDKSIKLGFNFNVAAGAEITGGSIESPSFATVYWEHAKSTYDVFLDMNTITVKNAIIANGRLQDSVNLGFSLGLVDRFFAFDHFAVFGKIGANYIVVDPALATKSGSWGLLVGLGGEHLFKGANLWGSEHRQASVFSQLSWQTNNIEADKQALSPKHFSFLSIGFGFRVYF